MASSNRWSLLHAHMSLKDTVSGSGAVVSGSGGVVLDTIRGVALDDCEVVSE